MTLAARVRALEKAAELQLLISPCVECGFPHPDGREMREEIRKVADELGCRNEADYLRRLHLSVVELGLAGTRRARKKG